MEKRGGQRSKGGQRRGRYPWREVFARESAPLVALLLLPGAALALVPQAVEVGLLEELLAAQPLGRVHLQAALHQARDGRLLTHCPPLNLTKLTSEGSVCLDIIGPFCVSF